MKNKVLLVTGCAGYIGATFTYEALKKNFIVYGLDNFSNSDERIIDLLLKKYKEKFIFRNIDLRNRKEIINWLNGIEKVNIVMHFSALKSVPDSEQNQKLYWENNVCGTENLLDAMKIAQIKNIVFSSSASVYGEQSIQPVHENMTPKPVSIYAKTKFECERKIQKFVNEERSKAISLRYFNPVGSHEDSVVCEDYKTSENLISMIIRAAKKEKKQLDIYGRYFNTKDGTAERDFIHINDLINGHFKAIQKINELSSTYENINLGTGLNISIQKIADTFKKTNQTNFLISSAPKRKGDLSINYANVNKAKALLDWQSSHNLEKMCRDAWEATNNEFK